MQDPGERTRWELGEQWGNSGINTMPGQSRDSRRAQEEQPKVRRRIRQREQQEEQPRRNDLGGADKDKCGRRGAYFFNMWV